MIDVELYIDLITLVPRFSTQFMVQGEPKKFESFRIEWDGHSSYKQVVIRTKHGPTIYNTFDDTVVRGLYCLNEYTSTSSSSLFSIKNPKLYDNCKFEWYTSNVREIEKLHKFPTMTEDEFESFSFQTEISRDEAVSEFVIAAANVNNLLPYYGSKLSFRPWTHLGSSEGTLREIVQELKKHFGV